MQAGQGIAAAKRESSVQLLGVECPAFGSRVSRKTMPSGSRVSSFWESSVQLLKGCEQLC